MKRPDILFIIKQQLGYDGSPVPSKGLFNSAQFVVNALRRADIFARLVEVIDGNDIDRAVARYRPTHCILEALWVTPTKLAELRRLHPKVNFVVRLHSKTPFLATEGIAMEWVREYDTTIATNAVSTAFDLRPLTRRVPVVLPNIYQPATEPQQKQLEKRDRNLWVGCLGAIRPLKNQLLQAVAAIHYAENTGRNCWFHINDRVEQGGEPVQKNLRALFAADKRHRLIEHKWCQKHEEVLSLVKSLDISMQASFTETFNIASADAVWQGVPIVVSKEISWTPASVQADTNELTSLVTHLRHAEKAGLTGTTRNLRYLLRHNEQALSAWKAFLKGH